MGKRKPDQRQPRVTIEGEVLRQIRQHARSNSKTEVCGVLIGEETSGGMTVTARIPGLNAAQAGTYVTFTQDTWEHIYKIKDKEYPDARIVGWYHSHPGFGVFLSDHDTFIHKNFFSSPLQVAWVYDPHSDEEGCFGWAGERIERLSEIHVKDDKGGEEAGETGKPEPVGGLEDEGDVEQEDQGRGEPGPPVWLKWALTFISHLLILAIGALAVWLLFPREVFILIDPRHHVAVPAPPGTRIEKDGRLSIPWSPELERTFAPDPGLFPQLDTPNPANPFAGPGNDAKSDKDSKGSGKPKGQKDQNVPRQ
ncbi:MAG TPA: Mov34/MPN/PAD-1 family protein [Dongiaceae bacterium]|nr:Mov34/MPN/PAD-1 family protein [Dongiaceae bacterium]